MTSFWWRLSTLTLRPDNHFDKRTNVIVGVFIFVETVLLVVFGAEWDDSPTHQVWDILYNLLICLTLLVETGFTFFSAVRLLRFLVLGLFDFVRKSQSASNPRQEIRAVALTS